MIEARMHYVLMEQQILDVGIRKHSGLYAEDCEYNYSTVVSCAMCNPNSTADQEVGQ